MSDDDDLSKNQNSQCSEDGQHCDSVEADGPLFDHLHLLSFFAEKIKSRSTGHGDWLVDLLKWVNNDDGCRGVRSSWNQVSVGLEFFNVVANFSLLSSERFLDSSGQSTLNSFTISLADLNFTGDTDRSRRIETEGLHLGGLHSRRLDLNGSWDQLLGDSWSWASSVDELKLLSGSGFSSSKSWFGVAVLDEEVKLVIHSHDLPTELKNISEFSLNEWLLGSISIQQLHEDWVSEFDLSTWLDEVGFWSSDGHVVSGLNASSEHAGVVARHLVKLVHRSNKSWNSEVVGLDDNSRLVGSIEKINKSTVTEFGGLSLLTELLDFFLQWSLLSFLGLILSSLVVVKIIKRNWTHSEVFWKSEDKSSGVGVGNFDPAGIELVLDEDDSAEWLSVVDLNLDSLIVADSLDGLSLDLNWWAKWDGGFWSTTVLGVLDGWLLDFLGGEKLSLRVLSFDDGSGDTVLGLWNVGSSRSSSIDFLGHTEILVEVSVLVDLSIIIDSIEQRAVSKTTVVVGSSACWVSGADLEARVERDDLVALGWDSTLLGVKVAGEESIVLVGGAVVFHGETVKVIEINSLTDLWLKSVVSIEVEKIAGFGLLVVIERTALLWGESEALGDAILDSLGSGRLENVELRFSLWKGSVDGANSLEVLSSWALLLLEVAGDIEIVNEEFLSFWDEEFWLALSGLRVQDALLFVVVVHDRLAHETFSSLWWWVGALVEAHGDGWDVLHDEGGESNENHLWDSLEGWNVAAGVWRSEALLLEVGESFSGNEISTSEWLGSLISKNTGTGLVVVHEGLAVEVVGRDRETLGAEGLAGVKIDIDDTVELVLQLLSFDSDVLSDVWWVALGSSTVVIHVDNGIISLIYEERWTVKTILSVQDALLINWVEHGRFTLESESVESIETSSHTDLDVLSWDDLTGESDENLLLEKIELEWRLADTVTLDTALRQKLAALGGLLGSSTEDGA